MFIQTIYYSDINVTKRRPLEKKVTTVRVNEEKFVTNPGNKNIKFITFLWGQKTCSVGRSDRTR